MELLDTALDDIVGFGGGAPGGLRRAARVTASLPAARVTTIQREFAAGADAYAAVVMASARGEVTDRPDPAGGQGRRVHGAGAATSRAW